MSDMRCISLMFQAPIFGFAQLKVYAHAPTREQDLIFEIWTNSSSGG